MGEILDLTAIGNLEEFLEAVAFQVEKDFGLMGFEFHHRPYANLESMLPELEIAVDHARTKQPALWMKIVYRVDLTEKQYRFAQGMQGETSANLAKGVLLREAQKVYTRKKFA